MRWVRPLFTTSANSVALRPSDWDRWSSAGTRSRRMLRVAATWIALGNTSFDDCDALTWSLGCTSRPTARDARVAVTSFAFMLLDVPDPVWKTSIGNCASCSPCATSAAAARIACAISLSSTPSSPLATAAALLIAPRAATSCRSMGMPESGKFSTARWVWARHNAVAGTRTSPIESCSTRNSIGSFNRGADGDGGGHGAQGVGEEVVALVVDDDEGGKTPPLDPPDRFHAELGVLQHLDLADAVLRKPCGRPPDRAEVEAAVRLAGRDDGCRAVSFRDHHHRAAGCLELVDVRVHAARRRRPERAAGVALRGLRRAGVIDRHVA